MLLYEESEGTIFDLDGMTAEGQASILALIASRGQHFISVLSLMLLVLLLRGK